MYISVPCLKYKMLHYVDNQNSVGTFCQSKVPNHILLLKSELFKRECLFQVELNSNDFMDESGQFSWKCYRIDIPLLPSRMDVRMFVYRNPSLSKIKY